MLVAERRGLAENLAGAFAVTAFRLTVVGLVAIFFAVVLTLLFVLAAALACVVILRVAVDL